MRSRKHSVDSVGGMIGKFIGNGGNFKLHKMMEGVTNFFFVGLIIPIGSYDKGA